MVGTGRVAKDEGVGFAVPDTRAGEVITVAILVNAVTADLFRAGIDGWVGIV